MLDVHLRFPDRDTGLAALAAVGVPAEDGGTTSGDWGACVAGLTVITTAAKFNAAGDVTKPPVIATGWHCELRLRDTETAPAPLVPFVVTQPDALHEWAGGA